VAIPTIQIFFVPLSILRCGWWWEIGVDGNVVWLEVSAWGWICSSFEAYKFLGFNLFEPLETNKSFKVWIL